MNSDYICSKKKKKQSVSQVQQNNLRQQYGLSIQVPLVLFMSISSQAINQRGGKTVERDWHKYQRHEKRAGKNEESQ